MKKILTALFLIVVCNVFCQSGDEIFIKNLATKLKNNDVWMAIPVTLKKKDTRMIIKNTFLYQYYLKSKVDLDFYDFLKNVLNGSYKINYSSLGMINTTNLIDEHSSIFNTYNKLGFDKFRKKFFTAEKQQLKLKGIKSQATENGIIQIMFAHHYYILFDDIIGTFSFYKNPPTSIY